MARRWLLPIVLLSALLHAIGIARSSLPAQDGLKFLRVARQFHSQPWNDVVRGSDQHPLYPALIAVAQPLVGFCAGRGPDSWRITAQVVSALASIATLLPLFALARALFDEATASLSCLLFVLLPLPAAVGHDTLGDPTALLFLTTALALGERTLRTESLRSAIGGAIAAGLGYLCRPEVAIVPVAVVIAWISRYGWLPRTSQATTRLVSLAVVFLSIVGSYAIVKGEVSEKLSLRTGIEWGASSAPTRVKRGLPPGLDDPRWDFSAKEETEHPKRLSAVAAVSRLLGGWAEAMGYFLAPLTIAGALWVGAKRGARLLGIYAAVFSVVLVRHAMSLGYLSARHTLSLVIVALPWASALILVMARKVRAILEEDPESEQVASRRTRRRVLSLSALVVVAVSAQFHHRPHSSRWGHEAAGLWLSRNAKPLQAVLDTRGWASFVSERSALDYWHVKQALVDPSLSFVVVGEDELNAKSHRAETLRAVLAYAAEPAISFPERRGGADVGVRVYRFRPPADWKGMRP